MKPAVVTSREILQRECLGMYVWTLSVVRCSEHTRNNETTFLKLDLLQCTITPAAGHHTLNYLPSLQALLFPVFCFVASLNFV
jgi:hypothetical protein